jgi:hypothetical protein
MGKRHEAIGIKQVIRFEWMQKAANLLLAGLDTKNIRQELHEFLADRKGNGSEGERGIISRKQVVTMLMKIWVSPDLSLVSFRDSNLSLLREQPTKALIIHWAMISSAYPFWFNVARQVGRLLALQDKVAQTQIIYRLKEHYGDRQTVSRYARFVIRSFIAWGVLKDSEAYRCYEKAVDLEITHPKLGVLLIESALLAMPEATGAWGLLQNNPAFFPFHLPAMSGDLVSQLSDRVEVVRYGLDDEHLNLRRAIDLV